MSQLKLEGISKRFYHEQVLRDAHLEVAGGCINVLIGPSGSGKSTLLKIAAGLLVADSGTVMFEGVNVSRLTPARRGIVYLSQEAMLFPHLSVFENVAYGLRARKMKGPEVNKNVSKILEDVGLNGTGGKLPAALSGGQKQRVAFARALVINPAAILLDEPFGSLDAYARSEMQKLFSGIMRRRSTTALFVTHDLREALTLGQRFALIDRGEIREFANARSFIEDAQSGVYKEFEFWKNQIAQHE